MTDAKIVCVKSDVLDNWYLIQLDIKGQVYWSYTSAPGYEKEYSWSACAHSGRFCDADVEGSKEEMLEIAEAIINRTKYSAKRCGVRVVMPSEFPWSDKNKIAEWRKQTKPLHVLFWSPRNSQTAGQFSYDTALALAHQIQDLLGNNS